MDPSVMAPLTGQGLPSGRVPVSGVPGPGYPDPVVLHVLVMGVEVIMLGDIATKHNNESATIIDISCCRVPVGKQGSMGSTPSALASPALSTLLEQLH